MKRKELKEKINKMSVEELVAGVKAAKQQLEDLQYAHAVAPIENPMRIPALKKEIAAMKTALRAQVLGQLNEQVKAQGVTEESAREFLRAAKFADSVNLGDVRRAIAQVK